MTQPTQSEMHAPVPNGRFRPFEWLGFGEFDLDQFAERMCFKKLQRELFHEVIAQLDIQIWFWSAQKDIEDVRRDPPGLELVVFMPCASANDPQHVCSANLFDLFEDVFMQNYAAIGYEEEISVIEKLKALCDRAIEHRRELIKEQSAETEGA